MRRDQTALPFTRAVFRICTAITVALAALWLYATYREALPPTEPVIARTVTASNAEDVLEQTRKAHASGHIVRVLYTDRDRHKPIAIRNLTETEQVGVRRGIKACLRIAERALERQATTPRDVRNRARPLWQCEVTRAALELLDEGNCFAIRGLTDDLESEATRTTWNISAHTREHGEVIVYFPIDLQRYPAIASARRWRR